MDRFDNQLVDRIAGFLAEVGIRVRSRAIDEPTFVPGLKIEAGEILVDESKQPYPGDLLHEAGHIAITAPQERRELSGTIDMPDRQGGGYEMAAIAWSYAALCHLGLDPSVVFHEQGYKGGSESLVENFSNGRYFGVPMLQWAGLTVDEARAKESGVKPYPHMIKWLR